MAKGNGKKPLTIDDIAHDIQLIAKSIKILSSRNEAVEKRLETVEDKGNDGVDSDDFGSEDKRKALSILSGHVFDPSDKMLPQMTETPDRIIVSTAVEHAKNEFLKVCLSDPDSKVLFSDLLMKWFDIKMRSRKRLLIQEAMGFSQIEMEKTAEEEARKLELEE